MSRKIILIKQELLLLVYELNRSGLLAENEKIRPILAQLEKLLLCDLRHQLTILSKTDALDEEKWLNMLGTFVKDWFRYESHFVHGRDSLVDILKERGLLSESDAVQYLAAAFPELNAWERAGADASSAGMVDAGFENQKELTKMQLDNQKEIAEMQNETQKEIAGIQSATSRQNTKDQVYAQNEMLAYQQKESTARVASIMENTNLSK